jgi:transposase
LPLSGGRDNGKKITGRGRHIVVDTEGWLLALVVVAASVSDKAGAKLLAARLAAMFTTLRLMWADACYGGSPLSEFMKKTAGITIEVVKRTSPHSFQVIRRRWVVERTFGWLMRYRRLCRDYEKLPENHEAMVYWATVFIMTKRLAKRENGHPDPRRWGGERPRPASQAAL